MAGTRLATLVRRLRREAAAPTGSSDADLLARFIQTRDDAAFELLVWRHGAMVLAACRRILTSHEDAEDAFQAVFLVLARKALSVARGAALPAWLHRVAVRIAMRLARSRRAIARLTIEPAERSSSDPVAQAETLGALDEEVNRLPDRFRRAVVLCYLDGLTAADAARQLGCPTGTVESRLAAARKRLRERLTRRGIALPAGILAVAGQAVLAPEAVARVAGASAAFARGDVIANETTAQLAKRTLAMWQTRKWVSAAIVATVLVIGAGMGWASLQQDAPPNPLSAAAVPTTPAPESTEKAPASAKSWPFAKRMDALGATLVGISQDGHTVVFVGTHQVYGSDLTEPKGENSLSFHFQPQNPVSDAAVSSDGTYVATAEGIHGVKLRDGTTGKVIEAFWPSGKLPTHHVAFSKDGTRLIALGTGFGGAGNRGGSRGNPSNEKITYQAQVSVWNLVTRKEVGYPAESTPVIETIGDDQSYPVYHLGENGRFVLKNEPILIPPKADPGEGPIRNPRLPGEPAGFRFTIMDTATGKWSRPVEVKDPNLLIPSSYSSYRSDAISPDGKTIVALDRANRNQVHLLDAATGKAPERLSALLRPVHAIAFSADGKLLAAASGRDGDNDQLAAPSEVVIWDVATGKELARLSDKESIRNYTALRFSPDGRFIVAQESEGACTFWGQPSKPAPAPPVAPKAAPTIPKEPPAPPAGLPERFQALFQSLAADGATDSRRIESVFLAALGRLPTDVESRTLVAQFARQSDKAAALRDLLNTLVSTDEFKTHAAALGKLSK